jgi:diguanylate cyclase (GGDEF)-like protein/PAS domain S-box-containing protein
MFSLRGFNHPLENKSGITLPLQTTGILSALIFLINFTFEVIVHHELYAAQYFLIGILLVVLSIWALVEVLLIDVKQTPVPLKKIVIVLALQLMTILIRHFCIFYINGNYPAGIKLSYSLEYGLATLFVPVYFMLFLATSKLLINAFSFSERVRANLLEKQMLRIKRAEAALRESESRYRLVINQVDDVIWSVNLSCQFTYISPSIKQLTGFMPDEVIGESLSIFLTPCSYEKINTAIKGMLTLMSKQLPTCPFRNELEYRRKDRTIVWTDVSMNTLYDADGIFSGFTGVTRDVTSLKKHQQQLEYLAHYDALTGLPNRVLLADRLHQAMIQCERHNQILAIAYLDLDGFKAVNDAKGHQVGDKLLIEVSRWMKESLREGDTLARIGGDEFVAVFTNLDDISDCEPILIRLLQAASAQVTIDKSVLQVSVSIGITVFPHDPVDGDLLMRHADQAMYVAKKSGKNCFHFYDINTDIQILNPASDLSQDRQ